MRMWMINPLWMCRQHLLGEHVELHMFCGHLKKGRRILGYVKSNAVEIFSIQKRHDQIVEEMTKRGMKHKSPIIIPNVDYLSLIELYSRVNKLESLRELISRCTKCRERFMNH